jgi:hypothetical protein
MRRGWPNSYFCQLCVRNLETSKHLFFECPFSRQIWADIAQERNCVALAPERWVQLPSINNIWSKICEDTAAAHKKGIRSLFILTCAAIWRERNERIFKNLFSTRQSIGARIKDEAREWAFAGAKALRKLLFKPP